MTQGHLSTGPRHISSKYEPFLRISRTRLENHLHVFFKSFGEFQWGSRGRAGHVPIVILDLSPLLGEVCGNDEEIFLYTLIVDVLKSIEGLCSLLAKLVAYVCVHVLVNAHNLIRVRTE